GLPGDGEGAVVGAVGGAADGDGVADVGGGEAAHPRQRRAVAHLGQRAGGVGAAAGGLLRAVDLEAGGEGLGDAVGVEIGHRVGRHVDGADLEAAAVGRQPRRDDGDRLVDVAGDEAGHAVEPGVGGVHLGDAGAGAVAAAHRAADLAELIGRALELAVGGAVADRAVGAGGVDVGIRLVADVVAVIVDVVALLHQHRRDHDIGERPLDVRLVVGEGRLGGAANL